MACFGAHGLERPQLRRTMLQTTKITRNLVTIAAKLPNILLLKDAHCIGARLYSPGVTAEERHHLYDWNRPKSARQCFRSDATPSAEGKLQETYARQEENYAWGFGRSHETSSLAGWKLQETAPLAPGKKFPLRRSRETPAKHPCSLHGIYKNPRRSRQRETTRREVPKQRAKPRNLRQRSIVTSFVFEGNLETSAGDGGSLSETTSYLSSQAATLLYKQGPDCDLER